MREGMLSSISLIQEHAGLQKSDIDRKSDGSYVTVIDREIESIFLRLAGDRFPDTPVLAEESSALCDEAARENWVGNFFNSNYQIVLDPVDGTRNFIEGKREYCIAVALTKQVGEGIWPLIGMVAVPEEHALYWNTGEAAFKEDLRSGKIITLQLNTSEPEQFSVNSKDRQWAKESGLGFKLPWNSSGSSVYDFLGTVTGRNRASLVGSQRLWDLMAPLSIALVSDCELIDVATGQSVTSIGREEVAIDSPEASWGLKKRFMLLRRGDELSQFLASYK
jgi:fructose-1,6-bisphosphatase/inositol monophosphatase family enzyme